MEEREWTQNQIGIIDSNNPDWDSIVILNKNGDESEAILEKSVIISICKELFGSKGIVNALNFSDSYKDYVTVSRNKPDYSNVISLMNEFLESLYK